MDPCPVLIGRENEMAALRSLLDAGGGVAIVSGEAGIGKSRLVREFAAEATERGRVVLWGRPEEVAEPGPYALIIDLLESIAERGNSEVGREVKVLSNGLVSPDPSAPAPTARALAAQIRGFTSRLEYPPLFALEDLHRGDELTHAALLHLARSAKDDAHLVVTSYRTELLEGVPSLARLIDTLDRERVATLLNLTSLTADEVTDMLNAMMPDRLDVETRQRIATLGEGVPFFIEELAEAAVVGSIPRSLELSVRARLHGLGSRAAEAVRAASLVEGAIDVQVLAAALNLEVQTLSEDLLLAVKAGLLQDRDGRLVFRHSLVRDSIAGATISVERANLHRRIAQAIESLPRGEARSQASILAKHWHEAGDFRRAADYHLLAGQRALALAATVEARAHFVAATVSADHTLEARRGLAEVEFREGNEDEAVRLFGSISDQLLAQGDRQGASQSLSRVAWALRGKGASEELFSTLDRALAILGDDEESTEYLEILVQKGQTLGFHFGRWAEARPILERALALAEGRHDDALIAQASDGLAHIADAEARVDDARRYGDAAMLAAKRSDIAEVIGRTYNNHAVKLASFGSPNASLEILREGREYLLHSYGSAGVSVIDVSMAWISWLMGLPTEVALLTARAHAAWQRWRGYRRILEVWSAVESGHIAEAQTRLASAWTEVGGAALRTEFLARPESSDSDTRQVVFAEALLLIHDGDGERAVDVTRALILFDRETFSESFDAAQGLLLYASALLLNHEFAESINAIDELAELVTPIDRYPFIQAHVLELRGLLAQASEMGDAATRLLEDAVNVFAACENLSDRARCHRRVAESILLGNTTDKHRIAAVEHLRTGLALADRSGANAERNRIEAALRSLGVRPRAGRPRKTDHATLTPREAEVAVLVAAGTTNARIAEELFLSERTVQDHISNALRKLGLSGRAGLATWAARQGLV